MSALTYYVENLKISDHVLIQENAYMALLEQRRIKIDADGYLVEEDDPRYDSLDFIEYSDDVYYCIPEGGYGPTPTGSTVDVSGSTFIANEVEEGELDGEYTLVLDDTVTIDDHTIIIEGGGSTPEEEGEAEIGDNNDVELDDNTEIEDNTLELSNSFDIENNTLIIL